MNTTGMIVKALRLKRDTAQSEVTRLDALIAEFGGDTATTAKPRTRKHKLTQAHIDKMQAGRKKARVNGTEQPGASLAVEA